METCGTQTSYAHGCRCTECRAAHAKNHRERRLRKQAGIKSDYDRVDPARSRQAIQWMRDEGLRWTQIEAITGLERVSLQRILAPEKKHVSRSTERILLGARIRLEANPTLWTRDAKLFPAEWTKWQVRALLARGWPEDVVCAEAGISMPRADKVQRKTAIAFDEVFLRRHMEWGPSRDTAVRMWRIGIFPADCYLWEERDMRPIPGSLRPELVTEALAYTRMHEDRIQPTRLLLQTLGQWEAPGCARTAMRNWSLEMGFPVEDYSEEPPTTAWVKGRSPWCSKHPHTVPEAWQDEFVEKTASA